MADELVYTKDELPGVTKLGLSTIEEEIRNGNFPKPRQYTEDEIEDVTGLSKAEIALAVRERRFPRPQQIAPGVTGWLSEEVRDWERAGQRGAHWRPPVKKRDLEKPTELYRHFDTQGGLLYVGIALSTHERLKGHRFASAWFKQVVTITIERFPTRAEAESAERAAIKAEKPLHNIAHAERP